MIDKLKSIGGPIGGFYFEVACVDEGQIHFLVSSEKKGDLFKISVDDPIHFQHTEDCSMWATFDDLATPNGNLHPLFAKNERFFEVTDRKYVEWLAKERYRTMDEISENEKLYIFFCDNSFVEIISFDQPIFTRVSSKEEFYESIKERVCWYPKEETDEQE